MLLKKINIKWYLSSYFVVSLFISEGSQTASESNQIYNCTVIKLTNTALFCIETKYLYIACTLSSDVGKVNSGVVPIKPTSYSNFTMRTQTLGQFQYCFRLVSFCGSVVIKDFPISKRFNQKRHSHIVTHATFVPQLERSETFPSS